MCLKGRTTGVGKHACQHSWRTSFYLNRSVQIWKFETKVDLAGYWQANKQPIIKTEVVDQLENIGHSQVHQRHGTLKREEIQTHTKTLLSLATGQHQGNKALDLYCPPQWKFSFSQANTERSMGSAARLHTQLYIWWFKESNKKFILDNTNVWCLHWRAGQELGWNA